MGGALIQLVAYGAQDIYITGNPQITFFKVVYKRHTNFSIESIEKTLNGSFTFGQKISCRINRNGDLLSKIYLRLTLPEGSASVGKWAWISKIGNVIIKKTTLTIGGSIIDTLYGDWINIWNELNRNNGNDRGYNNMIGNISDLTDLDSIHYEYTCFIPLPFFFCKNNGLVLPLIALQYHDVEINIELKPFHECIVKEKNCDIQNLNIADGRLLLDYIFLDSAERKRFAQASHEYLIEQVQVSENIVNSNLIRTKLNFNHPCKALYWGIKLNNYITGKTFLSYRSGSADRGTARSGISSDPDELLLEATKRFALKYAKSINGVLQGNPSPEGGTNLVFRNEELNPDTTSTQYNIFTRIGAKLKSEASNNNNAFANIKNIEVSNYLTRKEMSIPIDILCPNVADSETSTAPTSDVDNQGHENFDIMVYNWNNYGINIDGELNILNHGKIMLNNYDRIDFLPGNYFNYIQPYQYINHTPADGINMYSFALNPANHQPSGTCNFSRIDNAELVLILNDPRSKRHSAPFNNLSDYLENAAQLNIYAVNYNILRIMSGMGGLAYSN